MCERVCAYKRMCVTSTVDNVRVCTACLCPLCKTGRLGHINVYFTCVCVRVCACGCMWRLLSCLSLSVGVVYCWCMACVRAGVSDARCRAKNLTHTFPVVDLWFLSDFRIWSLSRVCQPIPRPTGRLFCVLWGFRPSFPSVFSIKHGRLSSCRKRVRMRISFIPVDPVVVVTSCMSEPQNRSVKCYPCYLWSLYVKEKNANL